MRPPVFSIVTPTFNRARMVCRTIESVLSQEGNFFLDYVVVDDGSSDGTFAKAKKYARMVEDGAIGGNCGGVTFRVIRQKNRGQVAAVNRGISVCSGDFLTWINSDDCLLPGALASAANLLKRNRNASVLVGAGNRVDLRGRVLATIRPVGLSRDSIADWWNNERFLHTSSFFARAVWDKCGPLDETFFCAFDLDFFIKVASCFDFTTSRDVWSEVTVHRGTKTFSRYYLMAAETFVVQARHGYEKLAVKNIESAVTPSVKSLVNKLVDRYLRHRF